MTSYDVNNFIDNQELLKTIQLYMESSNFNSSYSLETMFPEKEGVEYDKLKVTPEGEYSITRRADGKRLLQKMISIVGPLNKKHITDLTGNVGGDTILFGLNYKTVESIEYIKENFDALENNVRVFELDNVNLHFGDSTKLYKWYTDVLYIDPPWGGPDYKEKENLDLFLGDVRLDLFIKDILAQEWRPNYVFLKLPRNYNFGRLENLLNVKQLHKFSIRSFNCIALEVY
jgi:predicted RNA methylase